MNLKTSLKTVVSTFFELKLPVLGLLMLLFCITACNEHEVLPPSDSPAESLESFEALNLSAEEADFFSDEKINEIPHLKQAVEQLDHNGRGRFFFARSVQKTKRFVRNMNHQMEHKYIPHITQNVGQPVWLASYVAKLGGDMMTFVPLVPADEAIINGVLVYQKTDDGDTSYSLTTREQMASVETETDDQNYPLLVQMFYEFDKQLFNAGTEAYLDWGVKPVIELEDCSTFPEYTCLGRMTELPNRVITLFDTPVFDSTPLPDFGTEFPCYYICDAGCTADIYASGIADEEEIAWINGNCSYADVIDDFLADNDEPEIGQILLDAAILGYLTATESKRLANAIDVYLNDPDNANTDAACVVQEALEDISSIGEVPLALMCEMSTDLMAAKFSADYETYSSCNPVDIQLIRTSIINCQNSNGNCLCPSFDCILNDLMIVEDIIIKDESFETCERVNCVYDVLFDSMNELFCSTIGNFMESTIFDLEFRVANIIGDGQTTYDEENDIIILTISNFFCDESESTDLNVAATILHEGIHAELRRYLMDRGYDANNVEIYPEVWDNYLVEWYAENSGTTNDIHHAIMVRVDNYVDLIAEALWQVNDQVFTIEHYKHLAWDGLRGYSEQYADDTYGINTSFYPLHQELMASNPTLGCDQ
mgnify:CR=1 FL=1